MRRRLPSGFSTDESALMVAPIDVQIAFVSPELHERFGEDLASRSSVGSGTVSVTLVESAIPAAVELLRGKYGTDPLGFLVATESEALEAVSAGADEAIALSDPLPHELTRFLDRVRLRARLRRGGETKAQSLVQAQKLTALGMLVAGVGHEMNNPLSAISLSAEMLELVVLPDLQLLWDLRQQIGEGRPLEVEMLERSLARLRSEGPETRQLLSEITAATGQVSQLVSDLRVFSRNDQREAPSLFQPSMALEQALRLVRREFMSRSVIERDYEDDLPAVYLPRNRVTQVLMNLLVNAAQAIREVDRDVHRIRLGARHDEGYIALSVSDTGPGIPEEALERIFDPFYTTKREGQGTGLGLSISRDIIEQMGGDLVATSVYGDGAEFICLLPLPDESEIPAPSQRQLPHVPDEETGLSVLLIDDDERVLRSASRVLGGSFKVVIARDGEEAAELLSSGSHADVVVMELDLPEMDGPAFFHWLEQHDPVLARHVVVASGAGSRERYASFLQGCAVTVLDKPLRRDELLRAVHATID